LLEPKEGLDMGRPLGYVASALGISDASFTLLRDLIAQRLGQYFENGKRDLLADKISEIVAAHGVSSLLDYYYLLKYDPDAERHWADLADRLAVPETYFWRQSEQLAALTDVIAPRHAEEKPGKPLRIWSAACCSGEEPLSVAIALAEAGWLDRLRVQIVGSDASGRLLERARAGVYGERSFRSLPPTLRQKYFTFERGGWRIDRNIHQRVQWVQANLMDPVRIAPLAAAEVVYCRNVFIYFSDDAVRAVTRTIAQQMPEQGTLFLGAAESLVRLGTALALVEIGAAYAYQKPAANRPAARGQPFHRPSGADLSGR
jgi:chemotaxis protein methyltransferase CheR